jgi:hypothetical protein
MTWRCDSIACRENGRCVDSGKAGLDALVSGVLNVTEGSRSLIEVHVTPETAKLNDLRPD